MGLPYNLRLHKMVVVERIELSLSESKSDVLRITLRYTTQQQKQLSGHNLSIIGEAVSTTSTKIDKTYALKM